MRVRKDRRLTRAQAREIRVRWVAGESTVTLANEFGMSRRTIRGIVEYAIYRDAGGPFAMDRKPKEKKPRRVRESKRINFSADWVGRAKAARHNGACTWSQVARIVGKTIHKVRYVVDDGYRTALLRKSNERYGVIKSEREQMRSAGNDCA